MIFLKKHKEILNFIICYQKEKGLSPTVREICDAVALSSSASVHRHLDTLETQGFIERIRGSARAISVISETSQSEVEVLKKHKDVPSVILWQGKRYVYDPR
ncbi:LexA family protein [Paenibacillus elgii]